MQNLESGLRSDKQLGKLALMSALGIYFVFSSHVATADSTAYVVQQSGLFGTVDLNTGAFSNIGSLGITPAGLGVVNGTLFTANYNNSNETLYSINTANGNLTTIGSSTLSLIDFGSTTTGLYGIGADSNLYSINPTTGTDTLIGSTGISIGDSLSTNSSELYYSSNHELYTLNTNTGLATLVGNLGGSAIIGAMVFENGVLWGGEATYPSSISTINTTTGALATESSFAGTNTWGLAPSPIPPAAVPVPAAAWLFGSALAGFVGFNRRKSV